MVLFDCTIVFMAEISILFKERTSIRDLIQVHSWVAWVKVLAGGERFSGAHGIQLLVHVAILFLVYHFIILPIVHTVA